MQQIHRWQTWEGRFQAKPRRFSKPADRGELRAILQEAENLGLGIKVVGAGHSWSSIAWTEEWMLSLDRMDRVLSIDQEKRQIKVEAGIRLKALHEILEAEGMGMSNLGSVSEQSIAGAIATGTHGTGLGFASLANQIVALEMMTAAGTILPLSKDEDSELFDAARIGLGALGIVISVTLQADAAYRLRSEEAPCELEELLTQIQTVARSSEHVKFWWFPHTKRVQVWRMARTTEPRRVLPQPFRWLRDVGLQQYVSHLVLWVSALLPRLIPFFVSTMSSSFCKPRLKIDRSDRVFNIPVHIRHAEMEYAVPLEDAAKVLQEIRDLMIREKLPVNFILEGRFVKADPLWMSPAYGRDSFYLGVMMYKRPEERERWFAGCEAIFARYQGRPHWGKHHTLDFQAITALYPRFQDFCTIRQTLDPKGRFLNPYLRRCLLASDSQKPEKEA